MDSWVILLFAVLTMSSCGSSTTTRTSVKQDQTENCTYKVYSHRVFVDCPKILDLQPVVQKLREEYARMMIAQIFVRSSNLSEIPANIFSNLTIEKILFSRGTVANISVQAFDGIVGLQELNWNNITGLEAIPEAVSGSNLIDFTFRSSSLSTVDIQLQNMTHLKKVDLSYNRIHWIDPDAFKRCSSILDLSLRNNQIKDLDKNLFSSMKNLKMLYLNNNQLVHFSDVLEPISQVLEFLHLDNNLFSSFSDIVNSKTPKLDTIIVSDNPLRNLNPDDFNGKFLRLQSLSLDNTSLQKIEDGTFFDLQNLKTLVLSNNNISFIGKEVFPRSLGMLRLDNNLLSNLTGTFQGLKNLSTLLLSGNRIRNIDGMFNRLPRLQSLTISYNMIESIPNGCFQNTPHLITLSLGRNRIRTLNSGSFIGLQEKLKALDLSSNFISDLGGAFNESGRFSNLQNLRLSNNSLRTLSGDDINIDSLIEFRLSNNNLSSLSGAFVHLPNLAVLYIDGNQMESLERENFPEKISLTQVNLKGNPLICDCRLLWLVNTFPFADQHIQVDRYTTCTGPSWLKDRYLYRLKPTDLTTWMEDCPTQCNSCQCHPAVGKIAIYVDCHGRNITEIPTVYPAETTLLDLSNNSLETLPRNLSLLVPKLATLDLAKNAIGNLDDVLLPRNLNTLNISWNNFEIFPVNALAGENLKDVDLSQNPWLCDCQAYAFHNWLLRNVPIIRNMNETRCAVSVTNDKLGEKMLYELTLLDLCTYEIALYTIIAVIVILVIVIVGSITYVRYKMPIKVWLYSKGLCLRCVKEKDLDEDKDYDAFLAFSNEDEDCAKSLLDELEQKPPYYKLCVHYRDFAGRQMDLENIASAVKSSKKILVLLSKSFLQNEWSMAQFRQAYDQMLDDQVNRLILVLVGELPPENEIHEVIKVYLKTCIHLRWDDKYFLHKLRYVMPRNSVSRAPTPEAPEISAQDETESLINT